MHEDAFIINGTGGARTLSGSISVSGSKNAILPALGASLLFSGEVVYRGVPHIEDVGRMRELLVSLGCTVSPHVRGTVSVSTKALAHTALTKEASEQIRASIVLTGPLMARLGAVSFPFPGGCVIGERPIDIFLDGFRAFGASVTEARGRFRVRAPKSGLVGATITLPVPSVTGTETLMMTAVLARGKTTINNAAMEPEVTALAAFLVKNGARIEGAGTPTLTIYGRNKKPLRARYAFQTPPDRLEAGSWLILGALAAKKLSVKGCHPHEMGALLDRLTRAGVPLRIEKKQITVRAPSRLKAVSIKTHEYPGFPTDLQAPFAVLLTQSHGEARIFETIFEGRLAYTDDLKRMRADITLWNNREATVRGPKQLHGKELKSPDLRAGLAFLIAAAVARGTSRIENVYYIDRGYESVEEKLCAIGVDIQRKRQ